MSPPRSSATRRFGLLLVSIPWSLAAACGSGNGAASNPDAGAPGEDASLDAAASDTGQPGIDTGAGPLDSAAPGDGGGAADVGPISDAGTGTLTGSQAFPVAWTLMNPGEPAVGCMADAVLDGGVAATSIVLAEQSLSSSLCGDGGAPSGRIVDIEIATQQYAMGTTPLTQSLTAGTYVIGNEGQPDEDLCMLPSGSTAILQLFDPWTPAGASSIAISGTVTISSVGSGSIEGSFDVLMGGPNGTTDASPPPALSGTFNAPTCP